MADNKNAPQGPGGSLFTRKQQKRKGSNGGGKQMKIRATYATVTDLRFGIAPQPGMLPQVRVPIPRTRREKYLLGSPFKGK
jgi:hypothetical protein